VLKVLRTTPSQRKPKPVNALEFLLVIYIDGWFLHFTGKFLTRLREPHKRLLLFKHRRLVLIRQPQPHLALFLRPKRPRHRCQRANHQPPE
jgi:hypothetical protein